MKKYIIALGGLGTIVTPLVSVISCNKTKPAAEVPKQVTQTDLVTDKISSYLKTNKNVLLDALKTAREESNNTKEIKENLVANISSGDISNGLMVSLLSFDKELAKFATLEVRKNIVENNLTLIAPKGSLKRKGTYGITWVKGTKTIIESKELEGVNANVGFFGKLDTAMNFGGTINFAITSFSKLEDNVKIIPNLIGMGTFKGQQGEALESLKELDFTAKDFKDIISSVKMIVHNIDADLPAIMASNHKMKSLMELLKMPNLILDRTELNKGVQKLLSTIVGIAKKNSDKVGSIIDAINTVKPNLISAPMKDFIVSLSTEIFAKGKVFNLKNIFGAIFNNVDKIDAIAKNGIDEAKAYFKYSEIANSLKEQIKSLDTTKDKTNTTIQNISHIGMKDIILSLLNLKYKIVTKYTVTDWMGTVTVVQKGFIDPAGNPTDETTTYERKEDFGNVSGVNPGEKYIIKTEDNAGKTVETEAIEKYKIGKLNNTNHNSIIYKILSKLPDDMEKGKIAGFIKGVLKSWAPLFTNTFWASNFGLVLLAVPLMVTDEKMAGNITSSLTKIQNKFLKLVDEEYPYISAEDVKSPSVDKQTKIASSKPFNKYFMDQISSPEKIDKLIKKMEKSLKGFDDRLNKSKAKLKAMPKNMDDLIALRDKTKIKLEEKRQIVADAKEKLKTALDADKVTLNKTINDLEYPIEDLVGELAQHNQNIANKDYDFAKFVGFVQSDINKYEGWKSSQDKALQDIKKLKKLSDKTTIKPNEFIATKLYVLSLVADKNVEEFAKGLNKESNDKFQIASEKLLDIILTFDLTKIMQIKSIIKSELDNKGNKYSLIWNELSQSVYEIVMSFLVK